MANNALSGHFTTRRLLCFALPNLVMMVFLSLYTIVDGLFISRYVGTLALSAVNMSYPITSLELAIGIMLGTGGSAIVAKTLGEGDPVTARKNFTFIIVVSLVISVLFLILGLVFLDPLLLQLGTSEAQFPYCRIYTQILLLFSPALFLQCLFQVLFVTAGEPRLGLYSTVGGGLCNMVLDWLFMGCWGMGVEGAAIATVISYCVPAVMGLVYFGLWRKGTLYFVKFRPDWKMLAYACGNGSSELVSNLANAITTLLFNLLFLAAWQEDGVAAITIVMYLQFVFSAAYMGFSIGVAPVISYKYGAGSILHLERLPLVHRPVLYRCLPVVHGPDPSGALLLYQPGQPCLSAGHGRVPHLRHLFSLHGPEHFFIRHVYGSVQRHCFRRHFLRTYLRVPGAGSAPAAGMAGARWPLDFRSLCGIFGSAGFRCLPALGPKTVYSPSLVPG